MKMPVPWNWHPQPARQPHPPDGLVASRCAKNRQPRPGRAARWPPPLFRALPTDLSTASGEKRRSGPPATNCAKRLLNGHFLSWAKSVQAAASRARRDFAHASRQLCTGTPTESLDNRCPFRHRRPARFNPQASPCPSSWRSDPGTSRRTCTADRPAVAPRRR